jgi:predicted HAD superfamily Cof-like phosphohydrolase
MIKEIFDFNLRALGTSPKASLLLEDNHLAFCVKAIREEAQELEDMAPVGHSQEKVVDQVDALIDAAYFAIGGLARIGLTADEAQACFNAVHEANMTKKLGVTHRGDMGVADAAKPADWVGPEAAIAKILFGRILV